MKPRLCPRCGADKAGRRDYCRSCHNKLNREWRARVQADSTKRAARNARQREIDARQRADAAGRAEWLITRRFENENRQRYWPSAVGAYVPPATMANGGRRAGGWLDAGPLAQWMRREFHGWDHEEVARLLGVDGATVRRLVAGDARRVSLLIADRMFVNADCPHLLAVLYPLGEEPPVPKLNRSVAA